VSKEHAIDSHAIPTIEWPPIKLPNIKFEEPSPEGLLLGFLFRLLGAIVAVIFSCFVMLLIGAFNGWVLTLPLLGLHFAIISILVLLAEHFRSRVYERVFADNEPLPPSVYDIQPLPETSNEASVEVSGGVGSRILDIAVGALGLTALLPMMLLIALLIKTDSAGPVIWRTVRIGKGGRPFHIWKFRTMSIDSEIRMSQALESPMPAKENSGMFMLHSDPRITRVGQFLRRTTLDELPRLFNLLLGNMSLFGPIPLTPDQMDTIQKQIANRITLIKPGFVSLSNLGYWRPTSHATMESMLLADVQFHEHASAWQKLKLLVQVFLASFRGATAI
jgi:lipopolysaccharide/colanic/teichoic acid biosynthesis glycosyltransferase